MAAATDHKHLVQSKSGLRAVSRDDRHSSPLTLREPRWIPDSEVVQCPQCRVKFDFFTRRHHCRRCGNCFCKKCCGTKVDLKRYCFVDPVLVCTSCVDVSKKENDFFEKRLKNLLRGTSFQVCAPNLPSSSNFNQFSIVECKLTPNHKLLSLENIAHGSESFPEIELEKIEKICVLTCGGVSPVGNFAAVNGMALTYRDTEGNELEARFLIPENDPNKATSVTFISSLQTAIKMVFEKRSQAPNSELSCSISTSDDMATA